MQEVKKREAIKKIEIAGNTYHIKKFDAQTGSYIAYQLAMTAMPIALQKGDFGNALALMNKQQFLSLQADCLAVCYLVMPAGEVPVINAKGEYAMQELKDDVATIMALTLQALAHNVASFFDAPSSKELLGSFGLQITKRSEQ